MFSPRILIHFLSTRTATHFYDCHFLWADVLFDWRILEDTFTYIIINRPERPGPGIGTQLQMLSARLRQSTIYEGDFYLGVHDLQVSRQSSKLSCREKVYATTAVINPFQTSWRGKLPHSVNRERKGSSPCTSKN